MMMNGGDDSEVDDDLDGDVADVGGVDIVMMMIVMLMIKLSITMMMMMITLMMMMKVFPYLNPSRKWLLGTRETRRHADAKKTQMNIKQRYVKHAQ